jgi:hypothetical protein
MSTHPFFLGRQSRRAERLERFSKIGEALRKEAGGWDLKDKLSNSSARSKTLPECISGAISTTRNLLAEFEFPAPPQIVYTGTKAVRTANDDRYSPVEDGVIMLVARFITTSGVKNEVQIPVQIRQGEILQPSVMFHNGTMAVIAPSSVKEIIQAGTFQQPQPSRGIFSGPLTHQEQQHWFDSSTAPTMDHSRFNPGMFGKMSMQQLLRSAVRGQGEFNNVVAQTKPEDWDEETEGPQEQPEKYATIGKALASYNPVRIAQQPGIVRRSQLGVQPGRGDMRMKATPATTVGDRVETVVSFDPDQTAQMADGNLRQAIRSFILELGTKKEWRDWGTVADVQIDDIDRKKGEATVSFKSSETSAPQYSAPSIREGSKIAESEKWRCTNQNCPDYLKDKSKVANCETCNQPLTGSITPQKTEFQDKDATWRQRSARKATTGPSQDESSLQPAERDKSENIHTGDEVKLTKSKVVRSRGGGMHTLEKGEKGKVVGDIFGDGLHLKVKFEDAAEAITIPRSHLKKGGKIASQYDYNCPDCNYPLTQDPETRDLDDTGAKYKCDRCQSTYLRDELKLPKKESRHSETPQDMVKKIVAEIRALRESGYPPIDCIITAKKRYGSVGEQALKQARVEGLLEPEVKK